MNYKTAEQLGITDQEYDALIKVKEFLATIENPRDVQSEYPIQNFDKLPPQQAKFNMRNPVEKYDCGTACCIGGWMSLYMQGVQLVQPVTITGLNATMASRFVYDRKSDPLQPLFFPLKDDSDEYWDGLTPMDAIVQIELFLTTGEVTW